MNYVRISEYELAEAERWINRIPEVAKLNMKKMPSTLEIDARKLKYEERIRGAGNPRVTGGESDVADS